MIKTCLTCGKEFTTNYSIQKYCCAKCRDKASYKRSNLSKNNVKKICEVCGKVFYCGKWRKDTAKYCSIECQNKSLHGELNQICTNCGKKFHMKQYQFNRYNRNMGVFCSRECLNKYKKTWFKGENNHQFGLKGPLNFSFKGEEISNKNNKLIDVKVYAPEFYSSNKSNRINKHIYLILKNKEKFNDIFFTLKNGKLTLKEKIQVHHIDFNHSNNTLCNLIPLTRNTHSFLHTNLVQTSFNVLNKIIGVFKGGELLENLEEDNQQPSFLRDKIEGSETNSQVQIDSNADTSALLNQILCLINDYIVQTQEITQTAYNDSIKKLESQG